MMMLWTKKKEARRVTPKGLSMVDSPYVAVKALTLEELAFYGASVMVAQHRIWQR